MPFEISNKYWLVYVKNDGEFGVSNITPSAPIYNESQLQGWMNGKVFTANEMLDRGNILRWWIVESPTRHYAIKAIKSTAIMSSENIQTNIDRQKEEDQDL